MPDSRNSRGSPGRTARSARADGADTRDGARAGGTRSATQSRPRRERGRPQRERGWRLGRWGISSGRLSAAPAQFRHALATSLAMWCSNCARCRTWRPRPCDSVPHPLKPSQTTPVCAAIAQSASRAQGRGLARDLGGTSARAGARRGNARQNRPSSPCASSAHIGDVHRHPVLLAHQPVIAELAAAHLGARSAQIARDRADACPNRTPACAPGATSASDGHGPTRGAGQAGAAQCSGR